MALPPYYSSLGPFRETFRSGHPLLTYHHVGPRPRGARLKGLYVSGRLFAGQIEELKTEGFSTPAYDNLLVSKPKQFEAEKHIFLTFDDGFGDVFEHALPLLQKHQFGGIEFIVADLIGKTSEWQERKDDVPGLLMDRTQLREWLAAGNDIGSHSLTHPFLTRIPVANAREEISASKKKLEDWFGRPVRHFCYPFGDWNQSIRDLVVEAGYETACTTEFGVNQLDSDPFALKRITARYPSRSLKTLRRWLGRRREAKTKSTTNGHE
jgi:peptidoglycan/xylan/chitin deacetylase (PgdA/CDA1 family)